MIPFEIALAMLPALAVFLDFTRREVVVKIVYHGPGNAASDNLRCIYNSLAAETEATMRSTRSGLVVSFSMGVVRGFAVRLRLYSSVQGESYDLWRNRSLRNVDGIVFVADADPRRTWATNQALLVLKSGLVEVEGEYHVLLGLLGEDPVFVPDPVVLVLQIVGAEKPGARPLVEIAELLNGRERAVISANPTLGLGVLETVKAITKESLRKLARE